MTRMIAIKNQPSGYATLIDNAMTGEASSPRGMDTHELLGVTIELANPLSPMPTQVGRQLNPAIGYAEAAQLIGGVSHPEVMRKITPTFARFQNGGVLSGAYGPRIAGQMPDIIGKLDRDRDSRQAVAVIFDPAYDHREGVRDVPCTVELQFLIRHDYLYCLTSMRSNDVWWGTPYDLFQFGQLQAHVAYALNVGVGTLIHRVGSFHIYDRDLEAAAKVKHRLCLPREDHRPGMVEGVSPKVRWGGIVRRFQDVLEGRLVGGGNWATYADALKGYV